MAGIADQCSDSKVVGDVVQEVDAVRHLEPNLSLTPNM